MPASQILLPYLLSGAMVPQQQLSFFERGLQTAALPLKNVRQPVSALPHLSGKRHQSLWRFRFQIQRRMQTHRQTLPLFKRLRHLLRKMRRLLPYPETDSCRIRSHRRNLHHLRRHYENQYKTGSLQRIPNVSIRPDVSPDTALPPSRQSSLQRLQNRWYRLQRKRLYPYHLQSYRRRYGLPGKSGLQNLHH